MAFAGHHGSHFTEHQRSQVRPCCSWAASCCSRKRWACQVSDTAKYPPSTSGLDPAGPICSDRATSNVLYNAQSSGVVPSIPDIVAWMTGRQSVCDPCTWNQCAHNLVQAVQVRAPRSWPGLAAGERLHCLPGWPLSLPELAARCTRSMRAHHCGGDCRTCPGIRPAVLVPEEHVHVSGHCCCKSHASPTWHPAKCFHGKWCCLGLPCISAACPFM